MNATKTQKIIYWIATSIVLAVMTWSFVLYHFAPTDQPNFFEILGYPGYVKYPLAYLKLIAIIVIITNRYNNLKEMVYACYFINLCMAAAAHLVGSESYPGTHPWHAYVLFVAVPVSYILSNHVRGKPERNFLGSLTDPKTA